MDIATHKQFCKIHYLRWKRHGDPEYRTKVAKGEYAGVSCSAEDCEREAKKKGICTMHYSRDLRLKNKGLPTKYSRED